VIVDLLRTVWLTSYSPLLIWFLLAASAAWAIYLGIRGVRLMNIPAPIGTVGRQYVIVGSGRMLAVVIVGAMAAMQISF
jgi:hypothetical protein